jgi:endonuclease/exonuclease/phosphatase family metal-dependent hydrolase
VLTVLSYNIHRCIGIDRSCDPQRVARLIVDSHADIVGLQEVDFAFRSKRTSHQLDELAEMTGLSAIAGPTMRRHDGGFGNALLTRGTITKVEFHDLSVSQREPRGLIEAHIVALGRTVRVLVTHLGLRMSERRRQAQALLEILCDTRTVSDLTLVMGDINEWRPRGFALYSLDKLLGKTPAPRTFPVTFPLFSLDRIWVTPNAALRQIRIPDSNIAQVASDHCPILAVVDLSHPAVGQRTEETNWPTADQDKGDR